MTKLPAPIIRPVHPEIIAQTKCAQTEHFHLLPAAEFAAACQASDAPRGREHRAPWSGNVTWAEAAQLAADGDLSTVAASDAYLEKLETIAPLRAAWETIDDVQGAVPNVPAYIVGSPLSMRRRRRTMREAAPLAIVVDLTSSAGIDANKLRKRGIAILALVRALSGRRPIELWAGCSLDRRGPGEKQGAIHCYMRLDTSPLDLAHAAHLLSHPSVPRKLIYGACRERGYSGGWPYDNVKGPAAWRAHAREVLQDVLTPGQEALFIAAPHIADKAISDPAAWLVDMIATYSGADLADGG